MQGSLTEEKRKISHREDGEEIAKRQVSQKQGSTTEDRNIVHREEKERNDNTKIYRR